MNNKLNRLHELVDEAYSEGYEEGYRDGKNDWYPKGYHEGLLEMVEKLRAAVSDSCRDGHSSGGKGLNEIKKVLIKVKRESK